MTTILFMFEHCFKSSPSQNWLWSGPTWAGNMSFSDSLSGQYKPETLPEKCMEPWLIEVEGTNRCTAVYTYVFSALCHPPFPIFMETIRKQGSFIVLFPSWNQHEIDKGCTLWWSHTSFERENHIEYIVPQCYYPTLSSYFLVSPSLPSSQDIWFQTFQSSAHPFSLSLITKPF